MATMTGEDCLRLGDSRGRRCSGDSGGGELHVLAVDDSIVDRKVIERLLRISSCRVTAVESGRRALQYLGLDGGETATSTNAFHEMKVNLIMTDYSMPGMNGYELLKKIKESSALREIPVVIMSSENVMTRIDRCLEEGAEDFLLKPVKLSDVKRLKEYIKKGQEDENEAIQTHKRKLEEVEEEDETTPPLSPSSHLSPPSLAPSPSSPSATNHPSKRAKQLHDGV